MTKHKNLNWAFNLLGFKNQKPRFLKRNSTALAKPHGVDDLGYHTVWTFYVSSLGQIVIAMNVDVVGGKHFPTLFP